MGLDTIITRLNWVDILILILLIKIAYNGFSKGFSSQIFPLISAFATLIISLHVYVFLGQFVEAITPFSVGVSNFLSFTLICIALKFLFKIIGAFVGQVIKVEAVSLLERVGGLCLGFLRASVSISLVLIFLALTPIGYIKASVKEQSLLGGIFLKIGPNLHNKLFKRGGY